MMDKISTLIYTGISANDGSSIYICIFNTVKNLDLVLDYYLIII